MLVSKEKNIQTETVASLREVMERFNESSAMLESRHGALMSEVEDLRAQLRAKDEEIKRGERLAMLGETAAALAHEVRNPLGAIALFASMLKGDVADRPQALGLVDEIEKSVGILNHVVSNVLHFAKNKKLNLAPLNLHSLLCEVRQHFFGLYGETASISVETHGNPFIIADGEALRQCFYNLITNALQVTGHRGAIEISAREQSPDGPVVITVRDNGPGIPQAIFARMFEPFASARREGTGLGLSIVKRIVVAHGGEISARNASGAEFTMVLPRRAKEG
jgi:signal transduction histidine kinase